MEIYFIFLFITVFNLIVFFKFEIISQNLTFFDKPDGKLKKHLKPVSLIGGLIILINLYLIIFFLSLLNIKNFAFENNFIFGFILLSTLFYLIGLVDDLKNLSPNIKLIFLFISIIIVIYYFPSINLEHIKISSFLFIIFILKGFLPIFFTLLLICLIFLAILNYKNKVFLGDGGAYLISVIVGCSFIYQYNNLSNFFYGDEVFVILIIPAIDMLRLFFMRVIKKKSPFKGDLNHLHHIVNNFTKNDNLTVLITISLCIFPTLLLIFNIETYIILLLTILIYFCLISYRRFKI